MNQFHAFAAKTAVRLHHKRITKPVRKQLSFRIFEEHHGIRHPDSMLCKTLIGGNLASCSLKFLKIQDAFDSRILQHIFHDKSVCGT